MKKKVKKDDKIEVKMTKAQKEKIINYIADNGESASGFMLRIALKEIKDEEKSNS